MNRRHFNQVMGAVVAGMVAGSKVLSAAEEKEKKEKDGEL